MVATDVNSLNTTDRRIYDTQTRFLEEYQKCGTIKTAARAANISRETVRLWQRGSKLGFDDRFEASKETFRESLEEIMFERLKDPKTHPVLLIFALKAHHPDKYRDVVVMENDLGQRVISTLRDLQRRDQEEADANRDSQ